MSEKPGFQASTVIDGADVVSSGRVFQTRGPATVKTLMPTVESLTGGTSRLLELTAMMYTAVVYNNGCVHKRLKKVKGQYLYTATYMNKTSSGLQCEVAY